MLVLAGSRGSADSLARQAGVAHKCLIPVGGVAMITRVVDALRALPRQVRIVVATDRPEIVAALVGMRVQVMAAATSPSLTVLAALDQGLVVPPFLITTADHPLLTAEMIAHFWHRIPASVDGAAAVAPASMIRTAWPEARRTYLEFRDGGYSGCNLFAVMTGEAHAAIELWQRVEAVRKQPMAMMRLLGSVAALRFFLGWMSLDAAIARLSRLTRTRLAAVALPYPDAAIDIDKPEDLALAQRIFEVRSGGAAPPIVRGDLA